jgi:hypothetical protein
MRRQPEQPLAFAQRLAHEPEVVLLQVAQSTVDETPGPCRHAAAEILLLQQDDT